MTSKTVALLLFAFCAAVASGQDLVVKSGTYYEFPAGIKSVEVAGRVLFDSLPSGQPVAIGVIRVETAAANVEVLASDSQRNPVEVEKLTAETYAISKPGKYWVDVTAIDFAKNLYGRKTVLVEVGGKPGPSPNPPGPTPAPNDVPNEYGVGAVAYSMAPVDDPEMAAKYADVYKQAADFLFGVPTLKAIYSANDSANRDPNRSVIAWMNQQWDSMQCRDKETCQQWAKMREAVSAAIVQSQNQRPFSKQDWWNAFNEISRALRVKHGR